MNSKIIASTVIALSALTGASAFAQSNMNPEAALAIRADTSASTVTRAQVQSEIGNAGQNGEYVANAFKRQQPVASTLSRADVQGQALMAGNSQRGNSTI
ncbi:MAG: DUF4148 domain-containing protein [Pseudomonadota bacterium]